MDDEEASGSFLVNALDEMGKLYNAMVDHKMVYGDKSSNDILFQEAK